MSDYKPKVGEECEMLNREFAGAMWAKVTPKFIGKNLLVVSHENIAETSCTLNLCNFRPIPSKADIEREELTNIIAHSEKSRATPLVDLIQKAGFTKSGEIEWTDFRKSLYKQSFIYLGSFDDWWRHQGKPLLGHLIKNAPEDK
jgi:hypothetical protein